MTTSRITNFFRLLTILTFVILSCNSSPLPDGYINFSNAPVAIQPPKGVYFDRNLNNWEGGKSFIELQSMTGKGFSLPEDTLRIRPLGWQDSSKWTIDTFISGHEVSYTRTIKSKQRSLSLLRSGPEIATYWEGKVIFGTSNKLYYLVGETYDLSPENIKSIEESILTLYIDKDLSKAENDKALFELNLSRFPIGPRVDIENQFEYKEPYYSRIYFRNADNRSNYDAFKEKVSTKLSFQELNRYYREGFEYIPQPYVSVSQYGNGTNLVAPELKQAVQINITELKDPYGIRGICDISEEGTVKFGAYKAFYSKYKCNEGLREITGAKYAVAMKSTTFIIEYEVADWTQSQVEKLEKTIASIRLKEK